VKLGAARIGFAGYSRDFGATGDRRRFAAYARLKGIPLEYAELNRPYDLVYATCSSDLAGWTRRKRREGGRMKLVFELIDSYLTQTNPLRRLAKGSARFLLGADSRPAPDFLRTLTRACEAADVVICSTEEQRQAIRRYNPDVFISFDYFGDDIPSAKADYARREKLQLVWEGQSATLSNLRLLRGVLNDLRDRIELNLVTDPSVYRYFGRFAPRPSTGLLKGFECAVRFQPWDRSSFWRHVTASDLALIPIDPSDRLAVGKPENKLVMLWQLGMPVLATDTPAYARAMNAAGVDMLCRDTVEWRSRLEQLILASSAELERIGQQGRRFADCAYSRSEFLRRFDEAFRQAGFEV
jgi:hypothetical protein